MGGEEGGASYGRACACTVHAGPAAAPGACTRILEKQELLALVFYEFQTVFYLKSLCDKRKQLLE
jgi:hypothetical protein